MTTKEDLIFTDNNNSDKAILGILEGPCADFIDTTRNGRKYNESLWEKVFSDPIVSELIENGGIPGELDHPADREETDSSRIAIMMTEKPQKKNGKLWAKFSILNTPLGKIAYTLAKAGFKLGVSSRGSGDVYTAADGVDTVDEDTYDFKAFDLVLVPAVKAARLNLVTEGLSSKSFNYKKALKESLDNSNEEERKLMEDTLSNLGIELDESPNINEELNEHAYDIFDKLKYILKKHYEELSKQDKPESDLVYAGGNSYSGVSNRLDFDSDDNQIQLIVGTAYKDAYHKIKDEIKAYCNSIGGKFNANYLPIYAIFQCYDGRVACKLQYGSSFSTITVTIKTLDESLNEGTSLKRVASVSEFDNGHVMFNMKNMSNEEAEILAKEASLEDPKDVYYVKYDDIMNPSSDISWFNGKAYKVNDRTDLLKNPENYTPINDIQDESLNINEAQEITAVDNNEAIVEELQQTLKEKSDLESQITTLQEKLSVCYAKEAKMQEHIDSNKQTINKLSDDLKSKSSIIERLTNTNKELQATADKLNDTTKRNKELVEKFNTGVKCRNDLRESINKQTNEINMLNESLKNKDAEIDRLKESLNDVKKDLKINSTNYSKKLEESNRLVEKYMSIAEKSVDRYINSQAIKVGCSMNEIKNRLPKSYTFEDIDSIVEDLQDYKLNLNSLPILTEGRIGKISAKVSTNEKLARKIQEDELSEFELKLAGRL